ncbi:MAG: polysaccharide deacetylase family protein [Chloroflexi bacterium]|nr:polysaccharide deacetylase family protein [Chloroflexota bacterium]
MAWGSTRSTSRVVDCLVRRLTVEWHRQRLDVSSVALLIVVIVAALGLVPSLDALPDRGVPSTVELAPTRQDVPARATVISRGPTSPPVVTLTFDAGADRGEVELILDVLAQEGVRASFGLTGQWARANPDAAARVVRDGHTLFNHSDTHASFTGVSYGRRLTSAERTAEIELAEQTLAEIAGAATRPYFRPPFGDYDTALLDLLPTLGYTGNLMWTIDTLGWRGLNPSAIVSRALAQASPGAIYVMHVGGRSADGRALRPLIAGLRDLGYGFAALPELLARPEAPE